MEPTTILLVEDEPAIAALVRRYLERDGHRVAWARTGVQAMDRIRQGGLDLIVLDLGLPDIDGLDMARSVAGDVPVVILTARSTEPERLAGFAAGADDYVAKPFSPREVAVRVAAVLRRTVRTPPPPPSELVHGDVRVHAVGRAITVAGRSVDVTAREFELLWHLLERPGVILSRDTLLAEVWGYAAPGRSRTVDQHVAQLRRKLRRPAIVETVHGLGYRVPPAPAETDADEETDSDAAPPDCETPRERAPAQ